MSEVKPFTALVRSSSEHETLYGILSISRGDWQRMQDVGALMEVVSKKFPSMRKMVGWDASIAWFEELPWAETDEDRLAGQEAIDEQLSSGEWVEVDPTWVQDDHPSARRTECDEVNIEVNSVFFSFYPRHSDTKMETPWLMFSVLRQHFERR